AVPRLRPRLSLLVAETPPDKFVSLPIARVQFRNESFTLTNFIPPLLSVPATSGIGHQATQLAKRVREKAVFLSEKVRAQNAAVRESRVLDLQQAVVHLSTGLPHLEALLASG